jgi:hypothetical protein
MVALRPIRGGIDARGKLRYIPMLFAIEAH